MLLDLDKISNLTFDNVDHDDYPDYCDATIASGDYEEEGEIRELTDDEIEWINENESMFVYEKLMDDLY